MVVMGIERYGGMGRGPFSGKVSSVSSTILGSSSLTSTLVPDFQKPWLAAAATKYQVSL